MPGGHPSSAARPRMHNEEVRFLYLRRFKTFFLPSVICLRSVAEIQRTTMKRIINSLALVPLLFAFGCVTADKVVTDTTPRQPTTAVDIYKDGKIPDRKYKQIAELSFLGPREEELKAQKRFIR